MCTMKSKLTVCFLILVVLMQPFGRFWLFVSFKLNQQYIATELCINRDRPELQCNGQCVLMKKMKELEKREHEQQQEMIKQLAEIIYLQTPQLAQLNTIPTYNIKQSFLIAYTQGRPTNYHTSLLKPPKV